MHEFQLDFKIWIYKKIVLKNMIVRKYLLTICQEVKKDRPGLKSAIEFSRSGDTIVVWRLDRLGRNMEDLISIVNSLNDKGVSFHSLQENITMDKSSSTGQLMFHLFAAFAEFERNLILERSAAGREAARARGRLGGRPEKFSEQDVKLLKTW